MFAAGKEKTQKFVFEHIKFDMVQVSVWWPLEHEGKSSGKESGMVKEI